MKHILVITGSPRFNGNSSQLADAFIEALTSKQHQVTRFDAGTHVLNGCIACERCFSNGNPCVFDDDVFNQLALTIQEVDAIVFITPLYWYSFPTRLKAAIDKMYAFVIGHKKLKIKECAMIVCGMDKEIEMYAGISKSYELIAKYQGWNNLGYMIAPGLGKREDVTKTDYMAKAKEFATKIF